MSKKKKHQLRIPLSQKGEVEKGAENSGLKMSSKDKNDKKEYESLLADQWEISENSMLTDEIELANKLHKKNSEQSQPSSSALGSLLDPSSGANSQTASKDLFTAAQNNVETTVPLDDQNAAQTLINSLKSAIETEKLARTVEDQNAVTETKSTEKTNPAPDVTSDTDDFPTSANPFKHATDSGLIEIARSINTAEPTLLWLSESTNNAIRMAVASNPAASKKVIARLVKDMDGQVRLSTLDNPSLTSDLVVDLLQDSNPLISLRAYEILNERRKANGLAPITNKTKLTTVSDLPALKPGTTYVRDEPPITASGAYAVVVFLKMIARKYSTPSERLSELANHFDPEVRAEVAKNSNLPVDAMWTLVNDTEAMVKRSLLQNESVPEELIQELQKDSDQTVAKAARAEMKKFDLGK